VAVFQENLQLLSLGRPTIPVFAGWLEFGVRDLLATLLMVAGPAHPCHRLRSQLIA